MLVFISFTTNSGIDLESNYVGIAYVATMCSQLSSVGVAQDGRRRLLSFTSSTAAHELGHILNMRHDNSPSEYFVVRELSTNNQHCSHCNMITQYIVTILQANQIW